MLSRYNWVLKNFSVRRIFNLALVQLSMKLKLSRTLGKPYSIMIEPTNSCNLNCPLCPTGNKSDTRKKGYMTFETYKKVIDELAPYLYEVVMWNYGEPFLNPLTYDFISYAKQKRIPKVIASTNAHLFKDDKAIKKLINSGLDRLIISLDGMTKGTYEKYRRGGNIKQVLETIKKIMATKKALKVKNPFVELQFIVMRQNEHELPLIKNFAKEAGVDALNLKKVNIYMGIKNPAKTDTTKYLPKNDNFIREKIDTKNCPIIKLSTVVNWNGEVVPCCMDYYSSFPLGNTTGQSIKKIWNNKKYVNFRRANKTANIPICKRCNTYVKDINVKLSSETLENTTLKPEMPLENHSKHVK
ncbi:radical SAM protein [Candidatus Woesearchaeota archaeon]|nr:radical SAM protein [Candidatus Woesearchaeota archaeon]